MLGIMTSFAQNSVTNSNQQANYKRVLINGINSNLVNQMQDAGIDLTCGAIFTDNQLQIELNTNELSHLEQRGIGYSVLIDDLETFYSKRAEEELPQARQELQQMKQQAMAQRSYSLNEIINNVGQHNDCDEIDWAVPVNFNLNPNPSPNSFGGCLTLDMVMQELDDMRALYPNLISARTDASPTNQTSVEGRTIYYVRISDNPDVDENEPETLYQSLIHSRESATVMNQLFFMWYILENYDSDPAIRALVNNQELYFIPVFNPDGFVHNQNIAPNGGGLQRKNRNVSAGACGTVSTSDDYGIDLNRNSAYYWGNGGASTNPCSQTYLGTAPFSEPETQIMRDFFLQHDFELALNHHSFKNAMLHAYAGTTITNPRPDEYSKYNHEMTYFNRYAHGPSTSISALNSGNMNDWMLGGPAGVSANGTPTGTGSGKNTLSWTPENGSSAEAGATGSGFWPSPSNFVPIAKRAMRMNFMAAYFSGKYAKLHDLSQSDFTSLSGNLSFAVENLGQKASTFTVTVTPVSSNLVSVGAPSVQSGMTVLQQNNVNISYTLDSNIQPNDEIEYIVTLTNDYATDNVLYETTVKKIYNPSVLFADNPDATALSNWTTSGGTWSTTSDAFSGSTAITSTASGSYSNFENKQITLASPIDLSGSETAIVQFYAKWDLERSFDYVQLEASTNGTTWTPICGKLTKPGAPDINNTYSGKSGSDNDFQPDNEPLYDGDTQDRWNMEEVVIDATSNSFLLGQSTVYFRFDFRTDSSNRQDSYANVNFEGFTFDDFKVTSIEIPCNASNPPSNVAVSNVTSTSATVDWDTVPSATYDLRYRIIGAQNWVTVSNLTSTSFTINGLSFSTTYEVQVNSKCDTTSSAFSSSVQFTTDDNILSEGYFETGLDGWTEGGRDASRVQSTLSAEGFYSIQLRDSGTSASMTSPSIDATNFDSLQIDFSYVSSSFESGDDFWVQFFDGSTYTTIATYVNGVDFVDGPINTASVVVDSGSFNFPTNARFRIRCDASAKNDKVYIDAVIIKGISSGPDLTPPTITLNGSSTINLTVGDTYTELGATASDNIDGDITANIITTGSVNTNVAATYIITYTVSDSAGNEATETRTVIVNPDTTPPVITLNGTSVIDLNVGETYTEFGATATDDVDGDLTANIVITGTVDTNTAGTYIVTYSVSDAAGNSASENRTVNVNADTTPPVITLNGNATVDVNVGGTYTELGATATDNVDGDLTSSIVISGTVDTNTAGVYTITYSVSDSSGNSDSVDRTVNVIEDTTPPVITLSGASVIDLNVGDTYNELGATATDNVDGDLTANIIITGTVDTNTAGVYTVTYSVSDTAGNSASEDRTVNVNADTTPPVITLNGASVIDLNVGDIYNELGATATDNVDGDLTANIVITGIVDTNTAGVYTVTYSVSDTAGNSASEDRTVNVNADTTPPVITLNGASVIDLNVGDTYNELGATATDNVDGDLTSSIVITGSVNTAIAGTYVLTYSVSDSAGNNASVNRTVNVNALPLDQILSEGYFETGLDGWTEGGKDASRMQSSNSFEGFFSIRLRDNSGVSSSITSPTLDVSSFNDVEISFYLLTTNYNNGESVLLRYFDGSSWTTVRSYVAGTDFTIGNFYQATFTINGGSFNLPTNAQFRIQSNGSSKNDQVYIDQVIITGINSSAAARQASPKDTIEFVKKGPEEMLVEVGISIYPNPVKDGYLNIKANSNEEITFTVYDMLGKRMLNGTTTDKIDVTNLQKGVYFIELRNSNEILRQKFIKE